MGIYIYTLLYEQYGVAGEQVASWNYTKYYLSEHLSLAATGTTTMPKCTCQLLKAQLLDKKMNKLRNLIGDYMWRKKEYELIQWRCMEK